MRPIDGDALEEIVRDGLKEVPHNDGLARRHHKAEHIHFLDLIRRAPTIAPPPNDPLTLEELRGMDGGPIWVAREDGADCWALIRYQNPWGIGTYRCSFLAWNDFGKTWTAYRRRPENQKDFGGET